MTLQLEYLGHATVPLEVEGITPDRVEQMDLAAIERLEVFEGNRSAPLADYFRVSGDSSDGSLVWQGELAGVHWIGARMTHGTVRIEGTAGRHVGSEMSGGCIDVQGDAGDWVGGEMHGGRIFVRGSAGHLVGAAYRGSARGMTGGEILVVGSAGNEIGHTMRRGLIAVGGTAGDLAGFNMLAGTILLFGNTGIRHGAGMRRGTIAFLGEEFPPLLPSFRPACRFQPLAMRMLMRHLEALGYGPAEGHAATVYDLCHGDMIEGGRGEILLRAVGQPAHA